MRILITADPLLPVPPRWYGGIERVIALLVRGLAERGHELLLAAHPESQTSARLLPYGSGRESPSRSSWQALAQLSWLLLRHAPRCDVVHSFGRMAALAPILPRRTLPKLQSYQRGISWRGVRRAVRCARGSLEFTACSTAMYATQQSCTDVGRWHTIYNCVDTAQYNWCPRVADDAPLVFLGRLEAIKGAHLAIEIARQAGRKLVLAGNRVEAGDNTGYFDAQIAPHIDGQTVTYIGPVDDAAKNDVLGKAAALVMPIVWDEPFGIVMAEAMACGTPVIGFARGSVPEVVQNGATGFVVHDFVEAAAAVAQLSQIDRGRVRAECEQRFDFRPITAQYERLYQQLVERCGAHTRERA